MRLLPWDCAASERLQLPAEFDRLLDAGSERHDVAVLAFVAARTAQACHDEPRSSIVSGAADAESAIMGTSAGLRREQHPYVARSVFATR